MQFRVSIPPHVKSGQTIRIRCPDGSEGEVKVPKGLKGGDSFIFEMPKNSTKDITFLDREIASWNDFFMALMVGVLIGMSIIMGFLVGILYVTDADEE